MSIMLIFKTDNWFGHKEKLFIYLFFFEWLVGMMALVYDGYFHFTDFIWMIGKMNLGGIWTQLAKNEKAGTNDLFLISNDSANSQ